MVTVPGWTGHGDCFREFDIGSAGAAPFRSGASEWVNGSLQAKIASSTRPKSKRDLGKHIFPTSLFRQVLLGRHHIASAPAGTALPT